MFLNKVPFVVVKIWRLVPVAFKKEDMQIDVLREEVLAIYLKNSRNTHTHDTIYLQLTTVNDNLIKPPINIWEK